MEYMYVLEDPGNATNTTDIDPAEASRLLTAKIVILFCMLVASCISCFLPLLIGRWKYLHRRIKLHRILTFFDLAQGFGGGILLGGGLLHLMAEAGEKIKETLPKLGASDAVVDYPWAPLGTCIALGCIFFTENIFTALIVYFGDKHKQRKAKQNASDDIEKKEPITTGGMVQLAAEATVESNDDKPQELVDGCQDCEAVMVQNATDVTPSEPATEMKETPIEKETEHTEDHEHHGHSHNIDGNVLQGTHSPAMKFLIAFILWVSISTHALFEGMGLGTETHESTMWSIFAAIISHKLVESFTIGLIITKGFTKIWVALIFIVAFSIMSPIGISIGIGLSTAQASDSLEIAQGFILSVAAGAFIHVSLFEILFHQPSHAIIRAIRYGLFVLGFSVMAIIAVWA